MQLPMFLLNIFGDKPWVAMVVAALVRPDHIVHIAFYTLLIVFFTYFYTAITFNPVEVADNLKKAGNFIPGIRPGRPTALYLERILNRITLPGAVALAFLAIMPAFVGQRLGIEYTIYQFLGGTSMLIVVGVVLDTVRQMETHLIMRHYEGFMPRGGRIRGRRR